MRWTAAVLVTLVLGAAGARLLGYDALVVTSGSMVPSIAVGSLIVVQAVPPASVSVGEVISYALPDRMVTHRVQQVSEEDGRVAFVTRGDANDITDPWLAEPQGDVGSLRVVVPFAGFAVVAVQTWWRVIAASLLAWLLLDSLVARLRERAPRPAVRRPAHV